MTTDNESREIQTSVTVVGVAPMRRFSGPLITKTYATSDEWWAAARAASIRMHFDEEFRKEIEEFIS